MLGERAHMVSLEVGLEQTEAACALLQDRFGFTADALRRGHLEFEREQCQPAAANRALLEHGIEVSGIVTRRQSLEEYFVSLTGESQEIH